MRRSIPTDGTTAPKTPMPPLEVRAVAVQGSEVDDLHPWSLVAGRTRGDPAGHEARAAVAERRSADLRAADDDHTFDVIAGCLRNAPAVAGTRPPIAKRWQSSPRASDGGARRAAPTCGGGSARCRRDHSRARSRGPRLECGRDRRGRRVRGAGRSARVGACSNRRPGRSSRREAGRMTSGWRHFTVSARACR